MTITIDPEKIYSLAYNPFFWSVVYVVGLIITANIMVVRHRRTKFWSSEECGDSVIVGTFVTLIWPLATVIFVLIGIIYGTYKVITLPGRMLTKECP